MSEQNKGNIDKSGYFTKSYGWEVGDTVFCETDHFGLELGKEYKIWNDTYYEDIFVIADGDKVLVEDFHDSWFRLKTK